VPRHRKSARHSKIEMFSLPPVTSSFLERSFEVDYTGEPELPLLPAVPREFDDGHADSSSDGSGPKFGGLRDDRGWMNPRMRAKRRTCAMCAVTRKEPWGAGSNRMRLGCSAHAHLG
jgi:hypothetical protein